MTTPTTTADKAKQSAMLDRVRKLLAKAEAEGVTPQEAELFTAKAAELMARYGIDKAMAAARQHLNGKPANRVFDIYNPWGQVRAHLLAGIAGALGCQCVLLSARASDVDVRVHVFGFQDDIDQVDMLYTSLTLQMASALRWATVPEGVRSVRAWRRSYLLGWTTAVITRLKTAYAKAQQEADAASTSGPSTALVLADRSVVIRTALQDAYPVTRKTRITYSGRGYSSGYAKGQSANIHNQGNVGAGSGRALGEVVMPGIHKLYTSYTEAESDCDMIAGDNQIHMAVVERFDLEGPGEFMAVVVNITEARAEVEQHGDEAEIIYEADHTPEARARMQ